MRSIFRGLSLNIRAGLHEAGPWVVLALVLWWLLSRLWVWVRELIDFVGKGEGLAALVASIILTLLLVGYVRRRMRSVRMLLQHARSLVEKVPVFGRLAQVVRQLSELALRDPEKRRESRAVAFEPIKGMHLLALVMREAKGEKGHLLFLSVPLAGSLTSIPMVVRGDDPRIRRLTTIGGDEIATGVISYAQGFTAVHEERLIEALFAESPQLPSLEAAPR